MKILHRRNAPARSADVNGDGVVDAHDDNPVAARADGQSAATDRDAERTMTGRPLGSAAPRTGTAVAPDPAEERTVDLDRDGRPDRPVAADLDGDGRPDRPVERRDVDTTPVAVGPKPRASLLATLGLIVSVVGALFVLSGALAGYGIGLGAVGAVLAVLGLIATRRRHVAGKTDALIGVVVGIAAVVLGVVAMTGQFDWPTTDGEWVGRFREWLDSQFANWF
ncbi:thrombospondin [Micromonospora yasonensis]|uniref:thrombospondin n=1 Tax=Micromonospora yasonensis TaxID=1128667 RepID=UPI00223232FA|nr:thrombospondin [Micromonospora yasonensis]MCW3841140.1 thrombospondin [Micromonospora yasonensis]